MTPREIRRGRALLFCLTLLAGCPPFLHYQLLHGRFDTVRFAGGLLPLHFLTLRQLGEVSFFAPAIIFAALIISFIRPSATRLLLISSTIGFLVFTVAYLCATLAVIGLHVFPPNI